MLDINTMEIGKHYIVHDKRAIIDAGHNTPSYFPTFRLENVYKAYGSSYRLYVVWIHDPTETRQSILVATNVDNAFLEASDKHVAQALIQRCLHLDKIMDYNIELINVYITDVEEELQWRNSS